MKESLGTRVGINQSSLHLQLWFEYLPEMRQAVCYVHLNISKSFLYFQAIFTFKKEVIPERILQVQEGVLLRWKSSLSERHIGSFLIAVESVNSVQWEMNPREKAEMSRSVWYTGKKNGFYPSWWSRDFTNELKFSESILHNLTVQEDETTVVFLTCMK